MCCSPGLFPFTVLPPPLPPPAAAACPLARPHPAALAASFPRNVSVCQLAGGASEEESIAHKRVREADGWLDPSVCVSGSRLACEAGPLLNHYNRKTTPTRSHAVAAAAVARGEVLMHECALLRARPLLLCC